MAKAATSDAHAKGAQRVAAMIGDAREEEWLAAAARKDPRPGEALDGIKPNEWLNNADDLGLPPSCPIACLGVDDDTYWFLDTIGQLRAKKFSELSQAGIASLFMGRTNYLYWAWPQFNRKGKIDGWKAHLARDVLMGACARRGPWNSVDKARGRGAWKLADGKLLVHTGKHLMIDGQEHQLGLLDDHVYMTRPPTPRPWGTTLRGADAGPAAFLVPLLQSWNWARPLVDPILFLGWVGAAMIGGALPWRPIIFLVGDKARGKSTLQDLLKQLLGAALIQSADTTSAGIYQQLKHDALPVAVDELEGEADTRKQTAIIKLARLAASGAVMLRGGQDHSGVQFRARSCFLFSSINYPPLKPQDLSRMAMLQLNRLPKGQAAPVLDDTEIASCGRQLLRRMIDNWGSFNTTFAAYRDVLAAAGHDGRGQDTYGILLTCADMLIDSDGEALGLEMGPAAASLDAWGERLDPTTMVEYQDAGDNWRRCLNHILTCRIEHWRSGSRQTVGQVLDDFYTDEGTAEDAGDFVDFKRARALLNQTGLSLLKPGRRSPEFELYVPNQNPELWNLFQGTDWAGDRGAGVWAGALRQAPLDMVRQDVNCRISGAQGKGIAIPLNVAIRDGAKPEEYQGTD